jgi:SUMO ligase MMS21 Smc5/6 complex component
MDTFRSLLKIQSATEVGVNYQKYGELLIDAKTFVNEATLIISDGTIKKMFNTVIEEYTDAIKIWKHKIDGSSTLNVDEDQWNSMIKKYSIPTEKRSYGTYADADMGMQLIWAKATTDLYSLWTLIQSPDKNKQK